MECDAPMWSSIIAMDPLIIDFNATMKMLLYLWAQSKGTCVGPSTLCTDFIFGNFIG